MKIRIHLASWLALMLALASAGCQHPAPAAASVPASLIKNQTLGSCLKQIQSSVEKDTGSPLLLTEAAFAQSDELVISPKELLDAQDRPAQGRLRGVPESYRLSKRANQCLLTRVATSQSIALNACDCQPLAQR